MTTTPQEPNVTDDVSDLTDRQRDVLRLHQEGKNPTEIGAALGITSQAVHGHYRRLRARGLIEGDAKPAAERRVTTARNARSRGPLAPFDPQDTVRVVVATITAQLDELNTRDEAVDAQIEALKVEKKAIAAARKELAALVPPGTPE
jgi:DNA-binding MarR family transcriptional regulator